MNKAVVIIKAKALSGRIRDIGVQLGVDIAST